MLPSNKENKVKYDGKCDKCGCDSSILLTSDYQENDVFMCHDCWTKEFRQRKENEKVVPKT